MMGTVALSLTHNHARCVRQHRGLTVTGESVMSHMHCIKVGHVSGTSGGSPSNLMSIHTSR